MPLIPTLPVLQDCVPAHSMHWYKSNAFRSTAQLGDRRGLFELADRSEHLAQQLGGGRVVEE
jgi:hypothetical protein